MDGQKYIMARLSNCMILCVLVKWFSMLLW